MSRFHVFTNLAISFDGKISTAGRAHIDPSSADRALMDWHRARAHAVMMGAGTLRTFRRPVLVTGAANKLTRRVRGLRPQPLNVVISRSLDFETDWPFFSEKGLDRLLIVPESVSAATLKRFEKTCQIFTFAERPDYPEQIIKHLQSLRCANLLLEGGGTTMFPWVERDLIDEWNVTVCPRVIGGKDAPTMVEGDGFDVAHIKRYKLKKNSRKGDEVFLQYVRK